MIFQEFLGILYFNFVFNLSLSQGYYSYRYMRGREILEDVQQFLDTVVIKCFTLKYTLLPKRREAITTTELDLWNLYKSQEDYFKGDNY